MRTQMVRRLNESLWLVTYNPHHGAGGHFTVIFNVLATAKGHPTLDQLIDAVS